MEGVIQKEAAEKERQITMSGVMRTPELKGEFMKRHVTMKDIASEAEVSVATVSLVLSGKSGTRVSVETVRKIQEIAERLNYQPDINAQLLKGKDSSIVGLIIPNITNHFYSEMTKGVMDEGKANGYNVILFNSDNQLAAETFAAQTLSSMRVAGVIICGIYEAGEKEDTILKKLKKSGIQVVKIDRCDFEGTWPCVTIDNYQAAYSCVQMLYSQGHRKIALIASRWSLNIINDRERGYRQAMKDLGLKVTEDMIYRTDSFDFIDEAADRLAEEVRKDIDRYTAVLVIPGDLLAVECISYWKRRGIRIPEDISVMGFDNIYMGSIMEPSLTTIDQPKYEMGKEAMKLLLALMNEQEPEKKKIVFPHQIIIRGSTKEIKEISET
ncbi:LacI family DNA-binding transcriptional regulator [Clostridium sp. AM58-1XD]|uniref:LacI family DNA-binding transcriptional regulator n=1 Tax=Clostridium sp. AM58-1XD TaxID=2292307 RepID=UPI000E4B1566|nr:LacI family DNA-binding transcriptional regulator [Clostridium sp. AM58-1XD]RGY98586.1 LacI family transcriptional regulator [Clostridium sp. AM58-1XD]